MVGEVLHHVHQQMEVLFGTYLSDGKEEWSACGKRRFAFGLSGDVLHTIVDDPDGLSLQVELFLNLFPHKLGDTGDSICLIDGMLQNNFMLLLTNPILFGEVVQVVNGQHKLATLPTSAFQLLLRDGMPQVHRWQSLAEILMKLTPHVCRFHQWTKILLIGRR